MAAYEFGRERRQAILKEEKRLAVERSAKKVALFEQALEHPDPEVVTKTRKRIALDLADTQKSINETVARIAQKRTKLETASTRMKEMYEQDILSEEKLIHVYKQKQTALELTNQKSDETIRTEHLERIRLQLEEVRGELKRAQEEYEKQ